MIDILRKLSLTVVVLLFLTSSEKNNQTRMEIDNLDLLQVVGLDYKKNKLGADEYTFSYLHEDSTGGSSEEGGGSGMKYSVIARTALSYGDAIDELQSLTDKYLREGHLRYIIIGEEAAEAGITSVFDYLIRNYRIRPTANVFIARNTTAQEFLTQSSAGRYDLFSKFSIMENAISTQGKSIKANLIDVVAFLNADYPVGLIPALDIKKINESEPQEKSKKENTDILPSMDFDYAGMAVMVKTKMVDYLTPQQTRSLNFLTSGATAPLIQVVDNHEHLFSIRVIKMNTEHEFNFKESIPEKVKIKLKLVTSIQELHGPDHNVDLSAVDEIKDILSDMIKTQIDELIEYTRDEKLDIIGFRNILEQQHPYKWHKFKDDWQSVFENLEYEVEVESEIDRSFNISELIRSKSTDNGFK